MPDVGILSLRLREIITFSSEDPIPNRYPEADAVIIKAQIANKMVRRIYVYSGSSIEVMYCHCFIQLRKEVPKRIKQAKSPLVNFANRNLWPEGTITLPVIVGEHSKESWSTWNSLLSKLYLPKMPLLADLPSGD